MVRTAGVQDPQEGAGRCSAAGTGRGTGWRDLTLCPVRVDGVVLTVCAGDPRLLPVPAGLAPDGGQVALDKALRALVPNQGIDLIPVLLLPEGPGVFHHRGVSTGH